MGAIVGVRTVSSLIIPHLISEFSERASKDLPLILYKFHKAFSGRALVPIPQRKRYLLPRVAARSHEPKPDYLPKLGVVDALGETLHSEAGSP